MVQKDIQKKRTKGAKSRLRKPRSPNLTGAALKGQGPEGPVVNESLDILSSSGASEVQEEIGSGEESVIGHASSSLGHEQEVSWQQFKKDILDRRQLALMVGQEIDLWLTVARNPSIEKVVEVANLRIRDARKIAQGAFDEMKTRFLRK